MECVIVNPEEKTILKAKEILIDSGQGSLRIYPYHTDLISSIKNSSKIVIKTQDNKVFTYNCRKGILKIQSNRALILFDKI